MTQQLDPKQVRGLQEELDTLDSMAKIKTIGANLNLSDEGELSATGGGGGGGGTLYSTLGDHIDGAITQKASTDLLAHKDDFDTLSGTVGSLSSTVGTHTSEISGLTTAVAGKEPTIAAGTTSQYWRGDKSWQTLDKTAVGLSNVDNTSDATKKSDFTGSIASSNTGFVTGGDAYTALADKVEATQTVSTDPVEATVTTDDITTSAVTTAKIADGAVTNAKIGSAAVKASNIDFTTLPTGAYESNAQPTASVSTSWGNVQAISDLSAGKYIVTFTTSINQNDGGTRNILYRFLPSSGNATDEILANCLNQGTSYWNLHSGNRFVELTADGSITLQAKGEVGFSFQLHHLHIYAIKIG